MIEDDMAKAYGNGWGSHIPLLASMIAIAPMGRVLEVGVGHCSSPLIDEMCAMMGRRVERVDHDDHWRSIYHAADYDMLPQIAKLLGPWAVALVDSSPGYDRLRVVKLLREHCSIIVVHDTDNAGGDVTELVEYLGTFKYRRDYTRMKPWTTAVSDEFLMVGR